MLKGNWLYMANTSAILRFGLCFKMCELLLLLMINKTCGIEQKNKRR